MNKSIKLPKDRLGNAYYPATTTDAIVHPTKKQSLTEIIDNIKDVKIVDSVDNLDPDAEQGSLASVAVNTIAEVPFSELYQPPAEDLNLEQFSRVNGISVIVPDPSTEPPEFEIELYSEDFNPENGVGSIMILTVGIAILINMADESQNMELELLIYNEEENTLTLSEEALAELNNILSGKSYVYGGTFGPTNEDGDWGLIDPSVSDFIYRTISEVSKTELYIKDVEGWKFVGDELSKKFDLLNSRVDTLQSTVENFETIIVNSADELPDDVPQGTLASVVSKKPTDFIGFTTKNSTGSIIKDIAFNTPPITMCDMSGNNYIRLEHRTSSGSKDLYINVGTKLRWDISYTSIGGVIAEYDSDGNLIYTDQNAVEGLLQELKSYSYSYGYVSGSTSVIDEFVKSRNESNATTLYVKNETGWQSINDVNIVENALLLDEFADLGTVASVAEECPTEKRVKLENSSSKRILGITLGRPSTSYPQPPAYKFTQEFVSKDGSKSLYIHFEYGTPRYDFYGEDSEGNRIYLGQYAWYQAPTLSINEENISNWNSKFLEDTYLYVENAEASHRNLITEFLGVYVADVGYNYKLFIKNENGWEQYSKLVDQSVTTEKVADGAITMDKLSQDVKDSIPNVDTSNFVTPSALQTKLNDYSEVGHTHSQYLTEHQDISGKQDTLVSGTTIKTINGSSILGPGNIEILPGNDVDLSGYYSKTEVDATVNAINSRLETIENNPVDISGKQDIITDLEEIRSNASTALQSIPSEYITESELNTKGYLTEHQDISGKQDIIADLQTIRENASKGATALQTIPDEYVTETELIQKGYLTDVSDKQDVIADLDTIRSGAAKGSTALQTIPSEYITETKLNEKGYSTTTYVDNKVAALVNGAPETLDTIDELATALKDNKDIITVLENAIASKSDKSELSSKQDTIADLESIRTNSTNGQTAYNWGNHADAGYLQTIPTEYVTESELNAKNYLTSIPSEYVTETELTNKGYLTSASIPTKTSQLTNDSGFITQLKTVMSQSLIGSGNVDLTEAITNAVNNTNIESIKFKGILNLWSDFTKLKSLMDSIQVGEVFFCLPSLNEDVMGCMPRETSWRDLPIPASLSDAVDDVEKYVQECTGGVEDLSPINIHGARAQYKSSGMDFDATPVANISAIRKIGYYPMLLNLDEDVWKTMSFREGDMFCIAKMNYQITGIPLMGTLDIPVVLCFTWQIGSANANKYAGYNTLIHRWAPSANQCLKTGVYPWVTMDVPVANNAYTLFVESSTNRDDNGYNTIKQTAYGRQSDVAIYERMLIAKQTQLEYYIPSLSSVVSSLTTSVKLTCEWDPSDYVCIAYYNGDNKLTHWDMHVIQTMVDNTDAIVNEDNTIKFSSAFCNTVEGQVSLCIVDSMTPGPNGRLYPVSYKSTTVGSKVTAMDTLTILGDFAENPNTPWRITSAAFTSRGGWDANACLDSGVYPWVTGNVPVGNNGAFTLVVHKTDLPDGGGYYTIEQTAYGRQGEEQLYIYKRILFYKPATPGTDEVDVLENVFAWHKVNCENTGGLNITTTDGLMSHIAIGYEPGDNINSIASQKGSHYCIVDNKGIGYTNIEVVNNWDNTCNITITTVSVLNGIVTTYIASAEQVSNDIVREPNFNNITTWATTNTRSDFIGKNAIIPSVRNNTLEPVLVSKTEFISKYGFDPTNYTNEANHFTAITDIGVVSNTYINGYGLCEIELIEQEDTYDLCYSFEKAKGVTNTDVAAGTYTDGQIKTIFGVPFIQLGDTLRIRDDVYTVSMFSNYKKVYTNWSENATINIITIELKDDNYEITKNAFNIS